MTALAVIGHNGGPDLEPLAAFTIHVGDLLDEARNHLDGAGVNSDGEAEAVSKLLDMIRTAAKDAEAARKAEKQPHLDAGKAVDEAWRPILASTETAKKACTAALQPFLTRKAAEQEAAAKAARAEADARAKAAADAMRKADAANLAEREAAEALISKAKAAQTAATRAEQARPQATGGARATTLRTYYSAEIEDERAAVAHYWATHREDFTALVQQLADTDVRQGRHSIPGIRIMSEQRVV